MSSSSHSDLITMHYVDSQDEKCSIQILKELKIQLGHSSSSSPASAAVAVINAAPSAFSEEHCSTSSVSVTSTRNNFSVEFRDSADCWVRVILNNDDSISFPPSVFRRYSSTGSTSTSVLSSFPPSSDKEKEQQNCQLKARFLYPRDAIQTVSYHSYRELVCELCRQFFTQGWVTGTGGSISIKHGNRIYMTPSGVQKERIQPDELFVLDTAGTILSTPTQKPGALRAPKLSDCSPLFLHAFVQRNAGAVLHSHSVCCNIITSIFDGQSEVRISNQEMIKGIQGYGYFDELIIPIIENTAHEHELSDALGATIAKYPKSYAVLVRRHGMYVWGDSWEQAKRHGECYHYLFDVVIQMKQLGMDFSKPPVRAISNNINNSSSYSNNNSINNNSSSSSKKYKHVVFDIEGTTTPITFVKDVLFPYASANVRAHLESTWTTPETQADVDLLKEQFNADQVDSMAFDSAVLDASKAMSSSREATISFLVEYVKFNISKDRKIAALKQLQGHIWRRGYDVGALKSIVYDDVLPAFRAIISNGSKISIYSSGSREAQALLFKHTQVGDVRSLISCYFDTKTGVKRDASSYREIALHLGVDSPAEVLFVTDIIEEAQAAKAAGMDAVLSIRPGNAAIPELKDGFRTITTFEQLFI